MSNIKVTRENINKVINELERLKKTSYTKSELRNGNQMTNRLSRMQQYDYSRKLDLEQKRLKDRFLQFSLLDDEEKELHSFNDILKMPERKGVNRRRGGFFGF